MFSKIKPICGLDRIRLADAIPLPAPFTLIVFPTTFCNFRCVYCAHSLGYDKMRHKYNFTPQHMSMDTYIRIIEQASEFPCPIKMFSLTGHGEPLLNKNLPEMVRIAKESSISERIEIITNAALLTPETSLGLIDAGLDTIRLSIQGISAKKYKEICGADVDFDDVMENINFFYVHKKRCNLFVKVIDVALELGEDKKFYSLFRNCSDRMYIEKMCPVYDGVKITSDMVITVDRYGRKHAHRKVCPLPFFMLGIFPNGDVEPCDTIYKPIVIGNVNVETLTEMWNGNKLLEFRKLQLMKKRYDNKHCAVCCAPDDVAHPEDVLDNEATMLIGRFQALEE